MLLSIHRDARVVKDMATGKSKGYGFVSFFNKWVSCSLLHLRLNLFLHHLLVLSVRTLSLQRHLLSSCVCVAGCRECHPADGRPVVGRPTDQNQLGHQEAPCAQDYLRKPGCESTALLCVKLRIA